MIPKRFHLPKNPYFTLGKWMIKYRPNFMSDRYFLTIQHRMAMGYFPNIRNPRTVSEKMLWLKLFDRKPAYTTFVDKLKVKEFIAERIGSQYIIPTIAKYSCVEDINLSELPNQFVLKCNHDSGNVIICTDKSRFNITHAKEVLNNAINTNYYQLAREWPYKNVKRFIFAEQYMGNQDIQDHSSLTDYKFFCFDGKPVFMYIGNDRGSEPTSDFFDMEFNHLPIHIKDPNANTCPKEPRSFLLMQQLAAAISDGIPEVRVDFYEIDGKVYFGEMTFFHNGGYVDFSPNEWNYKIGDLITLPKKTHL